MTEILIWQQVIISIFVVLILPLIFPFLVIILFVFLVVVILNYKKISDTRPKDVPFRFKLFSYFVNVFIDYPILYKLFRVSLEPVPFKNFCLVRKVFPNGTKTGTKCYIFSKKNVKKFDFVMLYFIGGGFTIGHPLSKHKFYQEMIEEVEVRLGKKMVVVCPEYKKLPENHIQDVMDECYGVMKYVFLQHPLANIILSGDSAGGSISIRITQMLRNDDYVINRIVQNVKRRLLVVPQYAGIICETEDMRTRGKGIYLSRDKYLKKGIIGNEYMFTKFYESDKTDNYCCLQKIENLPSHLIFVGEHDVLHSENLVYFSKLKESNKDKDVFNEFYMLKDEIHSFLRYSKKSHDFVISKTVEAIRRNFLRGKKRKGKGKGSQCSSNNTSSVSSDDMGSSTEDEASVTSSSTSDNEGSSVDSSEIFSDDTTDVTTEDVTTEDVTTEEDSGSD